MRPSAGQRHPQPIRPMRELVFNFIKRLLQQEKIEKTRRSVAFQHEPQGLKMRLNGWQRGSSPVHWFMSKEF